MVLARLRTLRRGLLLAVLVGLGVGEAGAVCPSKSRPGAAKPQPSQPGGPASPPGLPPTMLPRQGAGAPSVPDDELWQPWWELNAPVLLDPLRRQAKGDGAYEGGLEQGLRDAVDALLEALADEDDEVRAAAAAAFGVVRVAYHAPEARAGLERAFAGSDPWVRDVAGLSLAVRGVAEVAPELRRLLGTQRDVPVTRAFAAFGLIALGDAEGLARLPEVARDLDEPELAGAVLLGLGQTRDLRHLPVLSAALERRAGAALRLRRVRADALVALGKLAQPSTVPLIATLLEDREKSIARAAALALGGFAGDAGAARALRERGLPSEDAFVRGYAALSLGRLREAEALPDLARLAGSDDRAAAFAALSLGLLGLPACGPVLDRLLAAGGRDGLRGAALLGAGLAPAPQALPRVPPCLRALAAPLVPSCAALAAGLLRAQGELPWLRERLFLDSVSLRPGFAEGAARLDPAGQAAWLLDRLGRADHDGERVALIAALGGCAGPPEAGALARRLRATPSGDGRQRVALVRTLARLLADREPSFAARLRAHTSYLQPNLILDHLEVFP